MSEQTTPGGTGGGCGEQGSVELFELLAALANVLGAANAPAGAACCRVLATRARQMTFERVSEIARAAEAQAAAEAQRVATTVAAIAAEADGIALVLDGGPSTLGVADWFKSIEQWRTQE